MNVIYKINFIILNLKNVLFMHTYQYLKNAK